MTTTRVPIGRLAQPHITAEAVALFARIVEIEAKDGDQCREYRDLGGELRVALGLEVWEYTPTTPSVAAFAEPPPEMTDAEQIKSWRQAAKLRRELEAALARRD
jgi:hypothetical protein